MFHPLLNQEYYSGRPAPSVEQEAYAVTVDGVGYFVDSTDQVGFTQSKIDRQTSQSLTGVPQEALGVADGTWRRLRESWHHGAGQSSSDRDDSLPYRFEESVGIDPWTKWKFKLLHRTEQPDGWGSDYLYQRMTAMGLSIYRTISDTETFSMERLSRSSPQVTQVITNEPGDVTSITNNGTNVFIGLRTGTTGKIRHYNKQTPPPPLTVFPHPVTFVAFHKRKLVAGAGSSLYEVVPQSATPILIDTDLDPSFTWVAAADGPGGIYLLGGGLEDGWAVYRAAISQDGTAVEPPVLVAELPNGEVGYALYGYMGFLCVGTNRGMRFAATASSGEVSLGQTIKTGSPVRCFAGFDRFIYYGNSNFKISEGRWGTGLGRLDLSQFTAPLTPAYASDVYVPLDPGQSEKHSEVLDVVVLGSRNPFDWNAPQPMFLVEEYGAYIQDDDELLESGYLVTGDFNYGTTQPKQGMYIAVNFEPLRGAVSVSSERDGKSAVNLAYWATQGSTSTGNLDVRSGAAWQRTSIKMTLRRGTVGHEDEGPVIVSVEGHAVPVAGRSTKWTIPIMLRDSVEVGGATKYRNISMDYSRLMSLIETTRPFLLTVGDSTWTVNAVDYQWRPQERSSRGRAWQGLFTLVCREVS